MRLGLISQLFASLTGKEEGSRKDHKPHIAPQEYDVTTRWEALVRYDDEIRAAAESLIPFGEIWVSRLGEAFFALNEDRKYLPNMVSRLIAEAEQEQEEQEKEREERLLAPYRVTADGMLSTEKSLSIIREALVRGYTLELERDKTIKASNPGKKYTNYLRSNNDIYQFGKFEKLG
jgi:hypothetical protein